MTLSLQTLPWLLTLASLAAMYWVMTTSRPRRKRRPKPLPIEWALTARPVFNVDERRAYRHLREAFPHYAVMCKLPLVRFCQPNGNNHVRYWYDLLGTVHVSFAICSTNGRVLAAIDLDADRSMAKRAVQIKHAVLSCCRIRYLRCPPDRLPAVSDLQALVPPAEPNDPSIPPGHPVARSRDNLASALAARRAERAALWQDSAFFNDSFYTPGGRDDPFASGSITSLTRSPFRAGGTTPADDDGGPRSPLPARDVNERH